MAKLRSVNTGMWDDDYFCELSRDERLLFVYFLTNRLTNMAGAYKVPRRIIKQDTAFTDAELDTILAKFEADKKATYRDGWIVLTNFLKNQSLNDNMKKGVISDISDAPTWVALQVIGFIRKSRTLSKAFEPFQSLISDVETLRKDEVEREREVESEKEVEDAATETPPAPEEPEQPTGDQRKSHPAIVAVREVRQAYPPKLIWNDVIDAVGMEIDVPRMRKCFSTWIGRNYSPNNFDGWLMDWYVNNHIPPQAGRNGNATGSNNNGRQTSTDRLRDTAAIYDKYPTEAELGRES